MEYAERFLLYLRGQARARREALGLWADDSCGGDPRERSRYCSDFSSQAEAQDYFEREGRVDDVDGDRDGAGWPDAPVLGSRIR